VDCRAGGEKNQKHQSRETTHQPSTLRISAVPWGTSNTRSGFPRHLREVAISWNTNDTLLVFQNASAPSPLRQAQGFARATSPPHSWWRGKVERQMQASLPPPLSEVEPQQPSCSHSV